MEQHDKEQQRYEALCAYVLGELPADERAEIERELAASPDLRAQRDELEATIGFVRETLGSGPGSGDELSESAAASVLARVGAGGSSKPRFHYLPGGQLTKIAAGLFLLTVGVVGGRALLVGEPPAVGESLDLDGTLVAEAELLKNARSRGLEAEELDANLSADRAIMPTAAEPVLRDELASAKERRQESVERQEQLARRASTATDAPAEAAMGGLSGSAGWQAEGSQKLAAASRPEVLRELQGLGYIGEATSGGDYRGTGDTVPPASLSVGHTLQFTPVPNNPSAPLQGAGVYTVLEGGLVATGEWNVDVEAQSWAPTAVQPPVEDKMNQLLRDLGYVDSAPSSAGPSSPGPMGASAPHDGRARAGTRQLEMMETAAGRKAGEIRGKDLERLGEGQDDYQLGLRYEAGVHVWTEVDRRRYLEDEYDRILLSCRRRPDEHPRDMFFRYWGDNPFEYTQLDPLSTFAADVDTASYTLARNYLNKGTIPPKAQVRTEEFVNYFRPEVPAPLEDTFAVHTELAPSRFGGGDPNLWMLAINVRGRDVAETERKPLRLTFVVDTSGSMKKENRMELVKHSLRLLLSKLDPNDAIALVAFSNEARLILPMTPASQRGVIESAIFPLAADGGTNAEAGLKMGYEVALQGLSGQATNRVVLLSDGVANVGQTDQDRINADVKVARERGIYLNTVGVGMGNHNDVFLEQLADKGDGLCNYVDSPEAARKALVENFTGQFEPIARDVKLQVEFDPQQVVRYRLLGYENRAIADADFRNDAVDAGELNAGHQVVALYELERVSGGASDGPLATVRVRWKPPYGEAFVMGNVAVVDEAVEREFPVQASHATSYEGASYGYRRAVVVAQFAELLRRSHHAREDSLDDLIAEAEGLRAQRRADLELGELVALLHQSRTLILSSIPNCDELCRTIDEIRMRNVRISQIERLQRDSGIVRELEQQNLRLEETIRDLLRQRLEAQGR